MIKSGLVELYFPYLLDRNANIGNACEEYFDVRDILPDVADIIGSKNKKSKILKKVIENHPQCVKLVINNENHVIKFEEISNISLQSSHPDIGSISFIKVKFKVYEMSENILSEVIRKISNYNILKNDTNIIDDATQKCWNDWIFSCIYKSIKHCDNDDNLCTMLKDSNPFNLSYAMKYIVLQTYQKQTDQESQNFNVFANYVLLNRKIQSSRNFKAQGIFKISHTSGVESYASLSGLIVVAKIDDSTFQNSDQFIIVYSKAYSLLFLLTVYQRFRLAHIIFDSRQITGLSEVKKIQEKILDFRKIYDFSHYSNNPAHEVLNTFLRKVMCIDDSLKKIDHILSFVQAKLEDERDEIEIKRSKKEEKREKISERTAQFIEFGIFPYYAWHLLEILGGFIFNSCAHMDIDFHHDPIAQFLMIVVIVTSMVGIHNLIKKDVLSKK